MIGVLFIIVVLGILFTFLKLIGIITLSWWFISIPSIIMYLWLIVKLLIVLFKK